MNIHIQKNKYNFLKNLYLLYNEKINEKKIIAFK